MKIVQFRVGEHRAFLKSKSRIGMSFVNIFLANAQNVVRVDFGAMPL
jgi:hypothetical protein